MGTAWMQLLARLEVIIAEHKRIRLESPDGKRFFEATVDGTTFVEHVGKVGETGTEARKTYPRDKGALAKAKSRAIDYSLKEWKVAD